VQIYKTIILLAQFPKGKIINGVGLVGLRGRQKMKITIEVNTKEGIKQLHLDAPDWLNATDIEFAKKKLAPMIQNIVNVSSLPIEKLLLVIQSTFTKTMEDFNEGNISIL
jgi:hypothetical protein